MVSTLFAALCVDIAMTRILRIAVTSAGAAVIVGMLLMIMTTLGAVTPAAGHLSEPHPLTLLTSAELRTRCASGEREIKHAIEQGGICAADSDCAMAGFGCPFGCAVALNSTRISAIADQVRQWSSGEMCGGCTYGCMALAKDAAVACVEGQCRIVVPEQKPPSSTREIVL